MPTLDGPQSLNYYFLDKNMKKNRDAHRGKSGNTTGVPQLKSTPEQYLHPISGCNRSFTSQNFRSFLLVSRKAGRNRANGAFGGGGGSAGSKCDGRSGSSQFYNMTVFKHCAKRTGNVRISAPHSCSIPFQHVVPSLVVITTSCTTYAPAPFPMVILERTFPVPPAVSLMVDHSHVMSRERG